MVYVLSKELKLRIISAVILGGIVLEITWFGGQAFIILWAVAAVLILLETTRISAKSIRNGPKVLSFICLIVLLGLWLSGYYKASLSLYAAGLIVVSCWEMFLRKSAWAAFGLLYAGLPFFTITQIRGEGTDSLVAVVVLFACVWGADIFAYIAGRSIGGPKLAPKISPNKTWSGFVGSLVGAIICSLAFILGMGFKPELVFFVVVLALAVISQIGDLVESSFKRYFGVKDSGRIIPGHGGVLDRIDGLIFAGILFWIILFTVKFLNTADMTLPDLFVDTFLI